MEIRHATGIHAGYSSLLDRVTQAVLSRSEQRIRHNARRGPRIRHNE
jgi:hypothetical protein